MKLIYLYKPYIKKLKTKAKLIFDIDINNEKKSVWFEVDKEYEKYLCDDRVDAIFIGVLSYAMRNGHDIKSDSYITDDILFKIKEYLLPSLTKYGKSLSKVQIDIKTKPAIDNIGAVGTGCSCGIDSLHAYITKAKEKNKKYRVTHLCINNVGSFNDTYKDAGIANVRRKRIEESKKFAKEVNLPLIITDSNFQEVIPQEHYLTHTYSSTFAILCLQKLWGIYYYGSSGLDLSTFNIQDNDLHDCADYELLSLYCFSTSKLTIYSDGLAETRLEKTEDIYQDKLVKKYLHTCLKEAYNCNVCSKCRRTLLSLYALTENLDEYSEIFDINYFNSHKEEYFEWIHTQIRWEPMLQSIYDKLLMRPDFKAFIESKQEKDIPEEPTYNYYQEECNKILNSTTYKVGKAILYLPYKLKNMIKKTSQK